MALEPRRADEEPSTRTTVAMAKSWPSRSAKHPLPRHWEVFPSTSCAAATWRPLRSVTPSTTGEAAETPHRARLYSPADGGSYDISSEPGSSLPSLHLNNYQQGELLMN